MYTDTSFQNIKQNISITFKIFIYFGPRCVLSSNSFYRGKKNQLFKKLSSWQYYILEEKKKYSKLKVKKKKNRLINSQQDQKFGIMWPQKTPFQETRNGMQIAEDAVLNVSCKIEYIILYVLNIKVNICIGKKARSKYVKQCSYL